MNYEMIVVYLILEPTESLSFDNVTQMYIDLPLSTKMRSHDFKR